MADLKVVSEVTGIVVKVVVAVGNDVVEFDPVVLIESMKMEIPVAAPRDGTIGAIHVAEGELVSEGDTVATLTT